MFAASRLCARGDLSPDHRHVPRSPPPAPQNTVREEPALQHLSGGGTPQRAGSSAANNASQHCCRLTLPLPARLPQLYALFGKYGAVRQIRVGNSKETRGTAYVVYEDIFDAKTAVDHLAGFNVQVGGVGCWMRAATAQFSWVC
jgi:hypothetical protein